MKVPERVLVEAAKLLLHLAIGVSLRSREPRRSTVRRFCHRDRNNGAEKAVEGNAVAMLKEADRGRRQGRGHLRRSDAEPIKDANAFWLRASQFAVVGLFAVALGVLAHMARPVVVPVITAVVIGCVLLPAVSVAGRIGIPRAISAVLVTLVLLTLFCILLLVLAMPASHWIGRASELGAIIREKLASIDQPLVALQELTNALRQITGESNAIVAVDTSNTSVFQTLLGVVTPAVGQLVLFFGALLFFLIYHEQIKAGAVMFFGDRSARIASIRILSDIESNISVYFGTFALINIGLGVATTVMVWVVGLPNPLLWGLLAALLNFVPYVGPAITAATLALVGLLTFPTPLHAIVAPVLFVAISTIEGHFLTPGIIGRRLTMNPFMVFLGIGFWTWLWGPIGAFLAVPMLMAAVVAARHLMPDDAPTLPE